MNKKTKILLGALGLAAVVSVGFYLVRENGAALAGSGHNLSGYAWSDNIGWISFNCTDTGSCGAYDYGVNVNSEVAGSGYREISGYAWSDNIGWIDFNPSGSYPEDPAHGGQLDANTGQVSGWARACAVFQNDCSGPLRASSETGGWDGWIKLWDDSDSDGVVNTDISPNESDHGVFAISSVPGSCDWSGWAWGGDDSAASALEGDEVIGWIDFTGVKGTGDACVTLTKPDLVVNAIAPIPDIIQGNSVKFSGTIKEKNNVAVTDNFEIRFCVDSVNKAKCFDGTSGDIIDEQDISSLLGGATVPVESNFWDSSSYAVDDHELFICADVNNDVSESSDSPNDNCKKKNFRVITASLCRNGIVDLGVGEQCDGSNLNGQNCTDLGFTGGILSCSASCVFDTNSCTNTPSSRPWWWWWKWQEI